MPAEPAVWQVLPVSVCPQKSQVCEECSYAQNIDLPHTRRPAACLLVIGRTTALQTKLAYWPCQWLAFVVSVSQL